MSRTDKTKPFWVRRAEHRPQPTHDHRFGDCDLPPRPTREAAGTRCRWEHSWFGVTCCSGAIGRASKRERGEMARVANRAERHAARRSVTETEAD